MNIGIVKVILAKLSKTSDTAVSDKMVAIW